MKRFAILAAFVMLIGCSQSNDELDNITNIPKNNHNEFYASMPECDTRTYVEDNKYLRWNAGDEITVFAGNSYNGHWQFAGEDGANSGKFNEIDESSFVTGTPLDLTANYAIYPYDENITITEAGVVSLTLPAVQAYNHTYANSFGEGANTMMAVTKSTADNFLSFKNLCGYLKLKFYGENVTVKSVTVKGNNGEKIAGKATVSMAYGGEPTITMGDDATDTITIDCGDGVALSNDAANPTTFWVVIPEITFEGGITIEVTDINNQTFSKQTTNAVPIENNLIQPMAALGVEFVAPVVKPANNEIWYTNGSTTEAIKLSNYYAFGAKYKSNKYDAVKKCWVLKFEGDVTKIGPSVFSECSNLTSITIPESVTSIGEYAFKDCSSLTSITIPEGVTSIGTYAFYRCSSLTSISIPKSVTSIGTYAFCGCTGELIVNCDIPSATSNSSGCGTFYGSNFTSATIGKGVTSIGDRAFDACTSLTSVTIPEGVTSIGSSAFYRCLSLTSISIPDSVTTIGDYAFIYCSSLTSVTIGDSVTSIGSSAFSGCSSLTSVTIPDSVTTIESGTFSGCSSLTSVTIPDSVTTIGDYAFESCRSLTSITIPDSVTSIGESAFRSSSLTSVTIPYGVTTIARYTFEYCSDLTSVTIPNSVTSIKQDAFDRCSSLTSITIPESVTEIVGWALRNCTSLTSVYCQATTPPSLGSQAFYNSSNLNVIYVPAESVEAYKSARGWSDYASYIQSPPYTPTECTALTITADDVCGNDTHTTIYYTAVTNGVDNGEYCSKTITGTCQSDEFPQNTSTTESIERTVSFTYLGQTATTTIIQGPFIDRGYTINLNSQWRLSSSVSNPDSSLYDGVYESNSNYNVHSASAWMYIDIEGHDTFTIYVRSYAESNYDYVTVYNLDSTSSAKMTTKGNQQSGTSISSYTPVTFSNIGEGSHRIAIEYKKDSSQNSNSDRGYVLIPKNQ